jgi:hypothetical protein
MAQNDENSFYKRVSGNALATNSSTRRCSLQLQDAMNSVTKGTYSCTLLKQIGMKNEIYKLLLAFIFTFPIQQ